MAQYHHLNSNNNYYQNIKPFTKSSTVFLPTTLLPISLHSTIVLSTIVLSSTVLSLNHRSLSQPTFFLSTTLLSKTSKDTQRHPKTFRDTQRQTKTPKTPKDKNDIRKIETSFSHSYFGCQNAIDDHIVVFLTRFHG